MDSMRRMSVSRGRRAGLLGLGTGLLVIAGLIAPGSVAAAGLVKERSQYQLEFQGSVECGSFQDNYVDRYDVTEVDVFDSEGTLLRVEYHAVHTSDDVNSVSGFTLHEHGNFYEVDDFVNGTITVTGNSEVANRAGSGVVIQDVGRYVLSLDDFSLMFFAGGRKHSQIILGEGIWCDALS
jgi:hypothetical protein